MRNPYESYMAEKLAAARWKKELPNLGANARARLEEFKVETPNGSYTGGINEGLKQQGQHAPAPNQRSQAYKNLNPQAVKPPAPPQPPKPPEAAKPPAPPAPPKPVGPPKSGPGLGRRVAGKLGGAALGGAMNALTIGSILMGGGERDRMTR